MRMGLIEHKRPCSSVIFVSLCVSTGVLMTSIGRSSGAVTFTQCPVHTLIQVHTVNVCHIARCTTFAPFKITPQVTVEDSGTSMLW